MLEAAGATVTATAPLLNLPERAGSEKVKPRRLTIDHINERQDNPQLALSASNLRFSTTLENTVLLRKITEMDPFQPIPASGRLTAGQKRYGRK